ncbi:MAG: GGDEF domain-containing protein, partial [Tissierellia bacterium]|nr:GGDEF domain-containing protein [Tissierellia bacterium]
GALANSFNDMIVRLNRMMVSRMELMEEIDRRIEAEKKLQRLSATDELTQLYNRRAFNSYGDRVINYSKRHDEMLSIVMIDIDYFKRVNDKYGHNVGDMVLIRLADILSQNVRENDILYRWGGEEFIILMPDTEVEEAHKIAERLRRIVAETRFTQDIHITISIGVTQLGDMDIFDKLIERVDKALYKAKESGRNNVQAL